MVHLSYPEEPVVSIEEPIASGLHHRKRAEEKLPEQTKQLVRKIILDRLSFI